MVKENSGRIRIRLKGLIANKEMVDRRTWSYADISAETGIGTSTLSKWARDKAEYLDRGTLAALCRFFGCSVGDVLEYVPDFGTADKTRQRGKKKWPKAKIPSEH